MKTPPMVLFKNLTGFFLLHVCMLWYDYDTVRIPSSYGCMLLISFELNMNFVIFLENMFLVRYQMIVSFYFLFLFMFCKLCKLNHIFQNECVQMCCFLRACLEWFKYVLLYGNVHMYASVPSEIITLQIIEIFIRSRN